jgi:hypothetical protein
MLTGARLGQEQEFSVLVARRLVSDGRAEYVDVWRNPVTADLPIAAESNPRAVHSTTHKRNGKRGRK